MSEAYWTRQCEIQHSKVVCCSCRFFLLFKLYLLPITRGTGAAGRAERVAMLGKQPQTQPHKHPAEPLSHRQHTLPSPRASRPCGRRGFFALPSSHILHVQLVRSRSPTFCVGGRGSSPSRPRPRGIPGKTGVEPAVGSSGPRGNLQRRCVRDELREWRPRLAESTPGDNQEKKRRWWEECVRIHLVVGRKTWRCSSVTHLHIWKSVGQEKNTTVCSSAMKRFRWYDEKLFNDERIARAVSQLPGSLPALPFGRLHGPLRTVFWCHFLLLSRLKRKLTGYVIAHSDCKHFPFWREFSRVDVWGPILQSSVVKQTVKSF